MTRFAGALLQTWKLLQGWRHTRIQRVLSVREDTSLALLIDLCNTIDSSRGLPRCFPSRHHVQSGGERLLHGRRDDPQKRCCCERHVGSEMALAHRLLGDWKCLMAAGPTSPSDHSLCLPSDGTICSTCRPARSGRCAAGSARLPRSGGTRVSSPCFSSSNGADS